MKVFIVRHGESEGNVSRRHQTETEVLTSLGEEQAGKVASRFQHIKIDRIISSPMTRAKQTAQAIASVTNAPILLDEHFKEIKHPQVIEGLHHLDPKAMAVKNILEQHSEDPNFHHSDEENYFDFISRVSKGLRSLEQWESEQHIVVTTHGHVLRVLFGLIIFGFEFGPHEFDRMIHQITTSNTGITLAEFTLERGWQLIAYNDHAHLLE